MKYGLNLDLEDMLDVYEAVNLATRYRRGLREELRMTSGNDFLVGVTLEHETRLNDLALKIREVIEKGPREQEVVGQRVQYSEVTKP